MSIELYLFHHRRARKKKDCEEIAKKLLELISENHNCYSIKQKELEKYCVEISKFPACEISKERKLEGLKHRCREWLNNRDN